MTFEALHGGAGWLTAGGLTALSFATSMLAAMLGLGGGVIMLAALASLLPAQAVIPVHGLVQLGSNAGRAAMLRAHWRVEAMGPFLLGAVIGVALGGALAVDAPASAIQMAVGAFILWSLVAKPPAFLRRSAWLAGGFSSFLTIFVGATGPFVAAYLRGFGFAKEAQIGTHAALMTAQHLLKTIAFGALGFSFAQWAPLICAMVASGFLGTLAGRAVLVRLDEATFRRAFSVVLALLGARLFLGGAAEQIGLW